VVAGEVLEVLCDDGADDGAWRDTGNSTVTTALSPASLVDVEVWPETAERR
jgi:hypothetical protein